jgi:hypothetical protein
LKEKNASGIALKDLLEWCNFLTLLNSKDIPLKLNNLYQNANYP